MNKYLYRVFKNVLILKMIEITIIFILIIATTCTLNLITCKLRIFGVPHGSNLFNTSLRRNSSIIQIIFILLILISKNIGGPH